MTQPSVSQVAALASIEKTTKTHASQALGMVAYAPPATKNVVESQSVGLIAYSAGDSNVTSEVTQAACLIAYFDGQPTISRQQAWTFVLDGHRFYVLPLGPEGDWAYDTTTQEWSQLQSQGFDGLNFTKGVMWNLRIVGGDSLNPFLLELDPTQPLDEGWREIQRVVTGGIPTRGRSVIGVANFSLTASVGDDNSTDMPISLAFSDDNGVTWSQEFDMMLTDASTQLLIWNALGSFSQPGRIFRITDVAGPVRLDGADCVLTIGSGADSGQDQEGQPHK
jgi:hypothetical protein